MQIVIDIDNDIYARFSNNKDVDAVDMLKVCKAIRKGTPLPKGHGRLIDADALLKEHKFFDAYPFPSTAIDNAPTIIEADVPITGVGKMAESDL